MNPERARFREAVFELYGYKTYDAEVIRFHNSDAVTKIASSPARTSKSYAAWKDVLPDVLYHGALLARNPDLETQRIWIVPPNYDLAKEFDYAYEDLVERRETLGLDYEIVSAVNNRGQGNMKIVLRWGRNRAGRFVDSIIEVKSAANERQLQSEEVDIAILSEAARLHQDVWAKYLATRTGRSIWPTTPDIEAAWIYKEIERGKANPTLKIENFQFTPLANPKYNYFRYWIEHQKAELRTNAAAELTLPVDDGKPPSQDNGHNCFEPLVDCNAMKDPGFAEQFGGQWTFTRGRVVPLRTENGQRGEPSHVIYHDEPWFKHCDVHISIDYGFTDPTVVMFWLVGPSQVVLRRSIYERGLTPDDVAAKVEHMLKVHGWKDRLTRMLGDPKKPEVVETFRRRGLPIWDIDKMAQADRKAGHLELMNFLATDPKTGQPRLLVHADNVEVIEEWSTLRYSDRVRDPNVVSALIGRDDAYDCARYFVQSSPPVQGFNKVVKLDDTDFAKVRRSILRTRNQKPLATVLSGMGGGLARAR